MLCLYKSMTKKQMWMASDRLMFQIVFLDKIEEYRDIEVDFGLLPYPKYDSAQEDYINLDWGGLLSVLNTITNPDAVGAAMELLAWESANEVLPAYYDVVLAGKLARDEDSAKMLDIIFDTIAYEIGGNYFGFAPGFNDLFYSLPRLPINQKSSDFSSLYAKYEKRLQMKSRSSTPSWKRRKTPIPDLIYFLQTVPDPSVVLKPFRMADGSFRQQHCTQRL